MFCRYLSCGLLYTECETMTLRFQSQLVMCNSVLSKDPMFNVKINYWIFELRANMKPSIIIYYYLYYTIIIYFINTVDNKENAISFIYF